MIKQWSLATFFRRPLLGAVLDKLLKI